MVQRDEISLREVIIALKKYFQFLYSKRRIIVLLALIGALAGLTASLLSVPVYTATTSFIVESSKKNSGGYSGIAAKLGLSLGSDGGGDLFRDDDNMMVFLKSRTMIAKTLFSAYNFGGKQEILIDRYLRTSGLLKEWKDDPRLSKLAFNIDGQQLSILEDSIVTFVYKKIVNENLLVSKPDKNQDLILVQTSSADELFAKAFNEQLISNVSNFYTQIQTHKESENVSILQHQVDSIRMLLDYAMAGAASAADANPNLNPAFQRIKVNTQRKLVDVEMNKSILVELVKNLELSRISLRRETPLVQIIDQPVLPLEKKRLRKIKGILLGGFLLGFGAILYFSGRYYYRLVMVSYTDLAKI